MKLGSAPKAAVLATVAATSTGCPVVANCNPYSEEGCDGMYYPEKPAERGEVRQRYEDTGSSDTGMEDTGLPSEITSIMDTVQMPPAANDDMELYPTQEVANW